MDETTAIELKRDCEATQIPIGTTMVLRMGTPVFVTQRLGGSFTVHANGGLFRIASKDGDALASGGGAGMAGYLDFEPSGADSTRFDNLKLMMDELHSAFTAYPGKLTSYAAHKYGTANEWWWSPVFYYYMARRVDILAAMTYDSGYFYPGPAVKDVPLSMAPADSQAILAEFGRPEYADIIANNPRELPLAPDRLIRAFARWDELVGSNKVKK